MIEAVVVLLEGVGNTDLLEQVRGCEEASA
jgi:hypothetical protein